METSIWRLLDPWGVYIASGTGIHVGCIKSLQQLFVIEGHTSYVLSVAISSDGKRIVSGSRDNTVRRWDADTGLPVGNGMEGHTSVLRSVAISLDGKRIVSGSLDKTVRWWDADTGIPVGDAMKGPEGWVVLHNTRAQARVTFEKVGSMYSPMGLSVTLWRVMGGR